MEEYPQTSNRLEEMGSNLYELIEHRNLVTYPDADVRLAVARAVAVETPRGWKITKEKTSHKIDVVVALAMAALGAVEGQGSDRRPLHDERRSLGVDQADAGPHVGAPFPKCARLSEARALWATAP